MPDITTILGLSHSPWAVPTDPAVAGEVTPSRQGAAMRGGRKALIVPSAPAGLQATLPGLPVPGCVTAGADIAGPGSACVGFGREQRC